MAEHGYITVQYEPTISDSFDRVTVKACPSIHNLYDYLRPMQSSLPRNFMKN